MKIENGTQGALGIGCAFDASGAEILSVAVKFAFSIAPDGTLAAIPAEISPTEQWQGEPGVSSLIAECDLEPKKLGTDIILLADAIAPGGSTGAMEVSWSVGPVKRRAFVFGERTWKRTLGIYRIQDPKPFERVPLDWERAFGGSDTSPESEADHEGEMRNPLGLGFRAKKSKRDARGAQLPQIEDPTALISTPNDRLAPIGFGFLPRSFEPRRSAAGTYDEVWRRTRSPFPPDDFDPRFHSVAPPEQRVDKRLTGGEPVRVAGCTAQPAIEFELPNIAVEGAAEIAGETRKLALTLDTVCIDLRGERLTMLWKESLQLGGEGVPSVAKIECAGRKAS